MLFGTICYLSDNEEARRFRWKVALKTFRQFAEIASWVGKPLHIVTTNWRDENFKEAQEVVGDTTLLVFHKIPLETRGANRSKNFLLNLLYESNEDYLFTGDDDTHVYYHYGFKNLIEQLDTRPQDFYGRGVYMILSHMANVAPFKKKNFSDPAFKDNWCFEYRTIRDLGYPMFHFNTYKHFGKKVLAPVFTRQEDNYLIREDLSYVIENLKLGLIPRYCTAFISTTIDFWTASTFNTLDKNDEENNIRFAEKWREFLIKTYPKVTRYKHRWVDYSAYAPASFQKKAWVPRLIPYEFTEKDIPKTRAKKVDMGLLDGSKVQYNKVVKD